MTEINNREDVLGTRAVIERFEQLESEQDSLVEAYREAADGSEEQANAINGLSDLWDITPEEVADSVAALDNDADSFNGGEELEKLRDFLDQMKGYGGDHQWRGDWYPVTLVRESYFEDYARELAEDIGAIKGDEQWPCNCIDWERAANELRMDYTSAEFDGVEYLFR